MLAAGLVDGNVAVVLCRLLLRRKSGGGSDGVDRMLSAGIGLCWWARIGEEEGELRTGRRDGSEAGMGGGGISMAGFTLESTQRLQLWW